MSVRGSEAIPPCKGGYEGKTCTKDPDYEGGQDCSSRDDGYTTGGDVTAVESNTHACSGERYYACKAIDAYRALHTDKDCLPKIDD